MSKPLIEFSLRGILLGAAITVVFTAAQVYLGLKVGLTFATSIPAAVISMALLRGFKSATIQENNIVQTIASAAGTLASVIFVLPGLIMIGWWTHVPFWMTFGVCAVGGILGVMYTIPLRRALVTQSELPYPEGVAAAEVLRVGAGSRGAADEGKAGFVALIAGSIASALYAAAGAARLFSGEVATYFRVGAGATGLSASSSLALMGAGHLMGISVGVAMFTGLFIAWALAVPILTNLHPMPGLSVAAHALALWKSDVRFLGAGTIAVAAIFTLGSLARPIWWGLVSALHANRAQRAGTGSRIDQDLPLTLVGAVVILSLLPGAILLTSFIGHGPPSSIGPKLIVAALAFLLLGGFVAATICGYMAGLIGASNSPISGIGILAVLGASLITNYFGNTEAGADAQKALVAFALYVTAFLVAVAVIANDNLQDLKTGQLVGATPWKQQLALVIGVLAGSVVIPPVLELLNQAYGFVALTDAAKVVNPLPAPQAALITTIAKGVIGGALNWTLLAVGGAIGILLAGLDVGLRRLSNGRLKLPPLGVGLAMYLPSSVTAPIVIGAVAGWLFDKWVTQDDAREIAKRFGILIASGLIVGESLFNVALAALIVTSGSAEPLSLGFSYPDAWNMLAAASVGLSIVCGLYFWARRAASKTLSTDLAP